MDDVDDFEASTLYVSYPLVLGVRNQTVIVFPVGRYRPSVGKHAVTLPLSYVKGFAVTRIN